MSLIDYVLGDRVGSYLLGSCLLVTALAIIAAILDIPLHSLHDAGYARASQERRRAPQAAVQLFGSAMLLTAFLGATSQAYITSSPNAVLVDSLLLFLVTNAAFFLAIAVWGLSPPLTRHWGLSLGAFGLGLAALFLLLAAVSQLPVDGTGVVTSDPARLLFALAAGGISVALAACLSAITALIVTIGRGAWLLATEHSRRTEWLTSDWSARRRNRRPRRTGEWVERGDSTASSQGTDQPAQHD